MYGVSQNVTPPVKVGLHESPLQSATLPQNRLTTSLTRPMPPPPNTISPAGGVKRSTVDPLTPSSHDSGGGPCLMSSVGALPVTSMLSEVMRRTTKAPGISRRIQPGLGGGTSIVRSTSTARQFVPH